MALTDNIVAYYKFDESSGNPADATGNGYALTNNNTVGFASGKINNGVDTGSSNSNKYLSIASDYGLNSHQTGVFSVATWIKIATAPSSGNNAAIFGFKDSSKNQVELTYANASGTLGIYFVLFNGASAQVINWTQTLTAGTWFHLIWVKNGTTVTLYVNGSSAGDKTITLSNGTSGGTDSAAMFRHPSANASYLSGMLDELAIWSRALTSDERSALYNSGSGLQYPFSSSAIKKFNGIEYAKLKKINGIEIAKVKKINGIA